MMPVRALMARQVRHLNLHEYQSKQLMAKHNVNVQRFAIAESIDQAENAARGLSKYISMMYEKKSGNYVMIALTNVLFPDEREKKV